jgi:hypothetical protein
MKRRRLGESGTALIEFAVVLPVLVLLLLAGLQFASLILLTQKVQRLTATMGDLVAQAESLTAAQLDTLFVAGRHVLLPFDHDRDGRIIVSAVGRAGSGPAQVLWQRADRGGLAASSGIGAPGGAAALPTGFILRDNETVIVSEAFHAFRSDLTAVIPAQPVVYEQGFYRPRLGSLTRLD